MLQGTPAPSSPPLTRSLKHPRGWKSGYKMGADGDGVDVSRFGDRTGVANEGAGKLCESCLSVRN